MKNRKMCILALWYVAGIAIAMRFWKKDAMKAEKWSKWNGFFDLLVDNIIHIHKNLYNYFEQKVATDENKATLLEYKEKITSEIESFKTDALAKVEEMKAMWITKKWEIEKELVEIYKKRQEYLDSAKIKWEQLLDEAVAKSREYADEWKKLLENTFEEIKKKVK